MTNRNRAEGTEEKSLPRVTYTNLGEDFSGIHAHFDSVIAGVEKTMLGGVHRAIISGQEIETGSTYRAFSPIDDRILLGEFSSGDSALAAQAVDAARKAYPIWSSLGWQKRVSMLRDAADELERRKYEVSAACLIEVGKSRLEAIGEVEEAIDLIRYYSDQMERNDGFQRFGARAIPNELTRSILRPYGVFAVIAPFNFPVALSLGMMTAALVAGNSVVFKPSEMNALTGRLIIDCLLSAGLPDGTVNLVFGTGAIGEAIVSNPGVDGVAFTGSNAVGMSILRTASSGRINRPVMAEMGGKNSTFVTSEADLEIAAAGVVRSAFGLQGQKCSAGSKVYVQRDVEEEFLGKIVDKTRTLTVGDPRHQKVFMGPLFTQASADRFASACRDASRDGSILFGGARKSGGCFDQGYYVDPTITIGLDRNHRLNRDELFLPFLSVQIFASLSEAIEDANRDEYGLTAGIYTSAQPELDLFLLTMEAGVLYANRASGATTGAWPGIQTFCGWKGSGTTGKGGLGSWYLPQFLREQSHTIFETAAATSAI